VVVTEEEVKSYWIAENERLNLAYIFLDPEKYAADIKVGVEEAKKYYQKNKEEFEVPEKVKVEYILISPEEFKAKLEIEEEELKKYYQEHPDEFQVEEKRRASHILISLSPEAKKEDKEKAREKLQEIKKKLEEGADFTKLAEEYSDDKASAEKGGDLGFFTYPVMTPEFSKAVFSLEKVGEISDVVETPYGFHLIKLTGIQPAYKKSFEEVREEIKEKLLQLRSEDLARQEMEGVRKKIEKGEITFEEYAKEHPERVKFPPAFAWYEKVEELSWELQFNRTAFSLEPGKISSILRLSEGYCIIRVKEKIPSYIPDWEEAKEEAMERLAREKAKKITGQRAKDIAVQVKEGKKELSSFKGEWEYQVLTSLTRGGWIKGISGEDREKFLKVVFSLPEGEVSEPFPLSPGYYIVKVLKREIPLEKFNQEKDEFQAQLLSRKKEEILSSWFKEIRERAKIVDNTSLFFSSSP
jgi:peptidyl-prolyl cis-trans isomerase D